MQITMPHGGGGRATQELIRSVFAPHLGNPFLDKLEDAAVFPLCGRVAYTTDSFVVTPLVFKGGDIGRLSICGTVNDLLMRGAQPKVLTAGFILEEGCEITLLEQIVSSMAASAAEAGVQIVAADTKVVEGKGGLYINTSGIGILPEGIDISAYNVKAGDAILVSGPLGDHQACIVSHRMGIGNDIKSDVAPLIAPVSALLENGIRIHALRDATRGGLSAVLNEVAEASACGADIYEENIPVEKETRALCDLLGLDPLSMANEGKFIAFIHPDDVQRALALLKKIPLCSQAVQIGTVREQKGVTLNTKLGGRRALSLPWGEGLPRIC